MSKRVALSAGIIAVVAALAGLSFYAGSKQTANAYSEKAHQHETHATPGNAPSAATSSHALTLLQDGEPFLGKADAPITIVEYSSMSCPHCAAFHKDLLPKLTEKYIDTGIAKYTNRHYPLNAPALRAAMLTLCVEPDQYFTFTKVLFELQDKWAFTQTFMEDLKKIATVGGLSPEKFDACMADKKLEESVIASRQEATDGLNISATPTLFVNGIELKGNLSLEGFDAAIAVSQQGKASAPAKE